MTVNDEGSLSGSPAPDHGMTQVADGGAVVTTTRASRVSGVVRVNLLPPEIAEESVLRKVQLGAGVAVAIAAALVGLLWYQAKADLSDAKDSYTQAQATNARLQAEQARLGNVDALFKQVDAADAMLKSASAYEIHMSSYLDEFALREPQNVYFQTVVITETPGGIALPGAAVAATPGAAAAGQAAAAPALPASAATGSLGTVTVTGVGYKHSDVAAWLDSFTQMTGVSGVYLTNATEGLVGSSVKVPTVNWSSTAKLTLAALAADSESGATP